MFVRSLRMFPFVLALYTSPVFAQRAEHRLTAGTGLEYIARQDQIYSPFVHKGASLANATLSWERSKRLDQLLEVRFSSLAAKRWESYQYSQNTDQEEFSTYPHYFTMVELNYGMAVYRHLGKARLQLGGILENNVQASSYNTGPFSFFGYFAAFGIGPWVGLTLPSGSKSSLDLSLRIPLLGWTARSPYLVNDDEFIENTSSHNGLKTFLHFLEDGAFNLPDAIQKLTFSARYTRPLAKRWDASLAYRLQFIRHEEPIALISFQQSLGLQIGLRSMRNRIQL